MVAVSVYSPHSAVHASYFYIINFNCEGVTSTEA